MIAGRVTEPEVSRAVLDRIRDLVAEWDTEPPRPLVCIKALRCARPAGHDGECWP